ncbi:MAG: 2-oxoacid:ferredoxin oxidoreductase subunit beta [Firmicutes bacterium]|nr:2-oxoacid:ferredoxin oxidoreductase subunit beta [Bacillota bacterium]
MLAELESLIRREAFPTIFCRGCGTGTVLNATLRSLRNLDDRFSLCLVGGIGCSGWLPTYIRKDVIHTAHGRAIPVATGLKLANPSLKVIVFTGDGDCLAIGTNHLIHAARRNIDLTVVMINNGVYAMTGGQAAPTTRLGGKTKTTARGNLERPLDGCGLAISAGATYVARWTTAHPRQISRCLVEAVEHDGFSYVEILSQCPTQAGRYLEGEDSPPVLLRIIRERTAKVEQLRDYPDETKVPLGTILHRKDVPEFAGLVIKHEKE